MYIRDIRMRYTRDIHERCFPISKFIYDNVYIKNGLYSE